MHFARIRKLFPGNTYLCMVFEQILVVCVGNICRSPMAEGLLSSCLPQRAPKTHVMSAGLSALVGQPADPTAIELMSERGINLSEHRARQVNLEFIKTSDLILVMETWQIKAVEEMMPSIRGRVHLLGRWGGFEIGDPFSKPREVFETSLSQIERGVNDWLPRLVTAR